MAKNTGAGPRTTSVKARSQVRNPKTGDFVKRDEKPGSTHKGEFMDVKKVTALRLFVNSSFCVLARRGVRLGWGERHPGGLNIEIGLGTH